MVGNNLVCTVKDAELAIALPIAVFTSFVLNTRLGLSMLRSLRKGKALMLQLYTALFSPLMNVIVKLI